MTAVLSHSATDTNNNNNCEFDLQGSGEHYWQPLAATAVTTVTTLAPWFPLTLGPCSL